ncbi:MAG: FKBP-type peptidyl-prolyl cis-trans isomerase [Bacteroidales bacterium]|nr:FKBP-type peptidyl-prolyl cis-trans isomerase [Bacteroidales bacterium]
MFCMVFLLGVICFCCKDGQQKRLSPPVQKNIEEEKIAVNREIVRRDNADIQLIANRYRWSLTQSPSGLCYQIIPSGKGKGKKAQSKDVVKIKGKIFLPDGSIIYNSETDGTKEFRVDRSEDATGLHELIKLMSVGDKAVAIIPSYLGFGISGDGDKIPPVALLICEIELIKIN